PVAAAAAAASSAASPLAVSSTAIVLALARRRILRPLDQLFRRHGRPVLVLLDQLQADAAASLVDFLHPHVEDVAALDDVFDVCDATRADVRDVQQAVRSLLQLDE